MQQMLPRWRRRKESAASAGDVGDLGRSPEGGKGTPLQYSCLENSRDKGAGWATVHGVARVEHNLATECIQHAAR